MMLSVARRALRRLAQERLLDAEFAIGGVDGLGDRIERLVPIAEGREADKQRTHVLLEALRGFEELGFLGWREMFSAFVSLHSGAPLVRDSPRPSLNIGREVVCPSIGYDQRQL